MSDLQTAELNHTQQISHTVLSPESSEIFTVEYKSSYNENPLEDTIPLTEWQILRSQVNYARSSQYHRRVLSQLGALLEFMIDNQHTSQDIQEAFVDQIQYAISGMTAWEDLETLVYDTCEIYPVCVWALYMIEAPLKCL